MEPAAAGPCKPSPASEIITRSHFAAVAAAVATTPSGSGSSRRKLSASSSLGSVVAASLLVAGGLSGGALLAWWAVAFHHAHAMLWMVPAGLILIGTPLVACLSVLASDPGTSSASADLGA